MFPTLIFGLVLLGVAVRYAVEPGKRLLPLLTALGILTMSAGALGFVTGFIKSCRAAGGDGISPVITLLGAGEALNCVALALVLIVLSALAASTGALRLARRPADEAS
ncbi:MAG TPA: hypothetical protein VHB21_15910 [Minicystis sp.]|nr:hypothetical protein [Minicystis sp.]